MAVAQDGAGFLWIGTEDGLNRYDGLNVKIYRPSGAADSLGHKWVRALAVDRRGGLWVGTNDGLSRYDEDKDAFVNYRNVPGDSGSLSANVVTAIIEDEAGRLWIATLGGGLNSFDRNTGTFRAYRPDPSSSAGDIVYGLAKGAGGILWLATDGGLARYDPTNGAFRMFRHSPSDVSSLSSRRARAVLEDRRGRVWVGTEDGGLNLLVGAEGRFERFRRESRNPRSLSHDSVTVLYEDRAGRILVGTLDGLNVFDESGRDFDVVRSHPSDPESLSYDYIVSLFEDRTGILWVGTRGRGLNKFVPDRNRFFLFENRPDDPRSLTSNNVRAVAEDAAGRLWVGTEDKGVDVVDRKAGRIAHLGHDPLRPQSLGSPNVYALVIDASGKVWIGTQGGGLTCYDPKDRTFVRFRHSPSDPGSLSRDSVRSLKMDRAGCLWVGTDGGGLNRLDPGQTKFVRYLHDPADAGSLSHDSVRAILEDRLGRLWVGTFGGGLSRWEPESDRFTGYRQGEAGMSLCGDFVMSLAEDSRGRLWIGTTEGLARLDPETGRFSCYAEKEGLSNAMIYGVLVDAEDHVWVSTNAGICRLDPASGVVKVYGPADGLQGNEFNGGASYRAASGEMFFGGTNGLNAFFPSEIRDNPFPPPVVLTDLEIFNRPVPVGGLFNGRRILERSMIRTASVDLRLSDRMITLSFAALHYAAPEKNRFAYRLDGFDEAWNDVGNRRFASYSNLKPGRYVFRVKAANNDGVWNEEGASLALRIVPPVWRTWWFQGLAVLALGLAVASSVWRRSAAARRRAADLERQVEARTAELRREIAVRRKAEEELDRRKKYLEAILFSSSNAIVATNADSTIVEWSQGAEKIFGWRRDEVLGRNIDDIVVLPNQKGEAVRVQKEVLSGRSFSPFEAVRHRKDGSPVDVLVAGAPVVAGGEIAGMMAVYTDITQIKKAEAAAREANRAKSEFLANMSHEIRTPMNGIFGMTELALETELTPLQREYLETIKTSADALMTIINDILDFSKVEAKKIELETIPFNLRDAVHSIISSLALQAENKGLEMAYEIPPDIPEFFRGDPGRLRQVLTNLLGNAVKFTSRGEVVLSVSSEEKIGRRIHLHFQVRDTGIGIPADKLEVIFDPFTQVDSSTTRIFGGTGLGLAISAQLVGLMNGRIWAESESGRGSIFHFTVELESETGGEEERPRLLFRDLQGLPVLVVDDNATNRRILKDILAHWGMAPSVAASADEAVAALDDATRGGRPIQLVLTDANMPETDGFGLAERIKGHPDHGRIVIMMLSSSGFRGDSVRCRNLGLAAYLTKPVKQSQLLDAIMLALGMPEAKAAPAPLITRHSLSKSRERFRILLAEDNVINQKLAVRILENRGHKVTVAGTGKEALETLDRGQFDLVLMDIQMPEMDGFQATAAIREREGETGGHLPIVAMTAHAMAGDRERCLNAGMDDYVSKPLKPYNLLLTIERTMDRLRDRP